MRPQEMDHLIETHIRAEAASDSAAAVSVYTQDVQHDMVGTPHGPLHGRAAAQGFYDALIGNIRTETMTRAHSYYGENFRVVEHLWTGTVPGVLLGVPGRGRRISFRILHVWEFRGGLISRENIWFDGGSVVAQLTAPETAAAAVA